MANPPPVGHTTGREEGQDFSLTEDTVPDFSTPCTKNVARGKRCWLVDRTRDMNEILLYVGLELHVAARRNADGDVTLALARSSCGYDSGEGSHREQAWLFAEYLVSMHPCIAAVEIRARAKYHPSLTAVLKSHTSLESLTIYGACTTAGSGWLGVVSHAFWRQSILSNCDDRTAEHDLLCAALELRLQHLTTLDVAELAMSPKQASRFTQALTTNKSVVNLAVSDFIVSLGESDSGVLFAAYLTNDNCRLKRLKLKSLSTRSGEAILPIFVEAVCKMKTLEDLNVDIATSNTLFPRTISLFADVVARNSTLRRLQLPSGTGFSCWTESYGTPDLPVRNAAQVMEPWLKALRSPNSSLNELRINLKGFGPEECHAFFEAVAANETLKLVSLQTVPAMVGIETLCATIREFELSDRVVIVNHDVDEESVKVLPLCPEISCVTVRQKNLPLGGEENGEPISSPYDVLSRCAHVTSIRAHSQDTCDGALLSSLTAYVRGACSLTDVEVDLRDFGVHLRDKERKNLETELMSALASNNRLVSIDVRCAILSKNDMKILVDGARSSRKLTRFSATVDEHWNWRTRDRRTELNHARNAAFAEIQECVARNTSLVRAAVEFVLGDRDAVMGVRAFELMHDHPDVLRMVRERAGVTRGQARNMVANAFARVRLCSLDDFMRMAGVVREKVECVDDQPGAGLRLTGINAYCWLHIRSFLKIGDVVEV